MNPKQQILATLLKRTGLFTDAQVEILLGADLTDGLAAAVTRLEMAKESDFLERLAPVLGMAYADLAKTRPTDDALRLLPARAVYQYNALPLAVEDNALVVALNDPLNAAAVDGLRLACGKPVRVRLAPAEDIDKAIKKYYGVGAEAIEKMIEDGRYEVSDTEANISKIDVNEMGQEASIVRFVNQIIAEADRQGATDIHVEPMEDELRIRYRIDGMLHKVDVPPQINRLKAAIISRLKVMANLDIAEKRLPMDGRIGIRLNGEDIDIRVSTCPTAYGESVSLRLLQKAGNFVQLKDLGMSERDFALTNKLITRPNGIILVTGPTGSGKSTSLYAFLHEINKVNVRIMTAEDPIEYEMKGINQVLVRSDIGLTFARALRAFLRQDPDIIMVGEIRDGESTWAPSPSSSPPPSPASSPNASPADSAPNAADRPPSKTAGGTSPSPRPKTSSTPPTAATPARTPATKAAAPSSSSSTSPNASAPSSSAATPPPTSARPPWKKAWPPSAKTAGERSSPASPPSRNSSASPKTPNDPRMEAASRPEAWTAGSLEVWRLGSLDRASSVAPQGRSCIS